MSVAEPGEERLVAAGDVDDRQPVMHEGDAADDAVPGAVRAAMRQRLGERVDHGRAGGLCAALHDGAGDAAHQAFSIVAKVVRHCARTGASANSAS